MIRFLGKSGNMVISPVFKLKKMGENLEVPVLPRNSEDNLHPDDTFIETGAFGYMLSPKQSGCQAVIGQIRIQQFTGRTIKFVFSIGRRQFIY